MTSLSGVTDARDQSLESSQRDRSKKFCKLFWRVADKHRQIFAVLQNCPMKNWIKTVAYDLKQEKKAELYCDVNRKEIFVQICMSPIEIR